MQITLASVRVKAQDHALRFNMTVLGFEKKSDMTCGYVRLHRETSDDIEDD